jgi:hypothetical protein
MCDETLGCATNFSVCSKCQVCSPSDTTGQCIASPDIQCDACSTCNPLSGICTDAGMKLWFSSLLVPRNWLGLCNACQECTIDIATGYGYSCRTKENLCKPCEQCDALTGQCAAIECASCQVCNPAVNRCEVSVNATCVSESHPCHVAYCGLNGTCITTANNAAVGAPCRLEEDCSAYVCTADGQVCKLLLSIIPRE